MAFEIIQIYGTGTGGTQNGLASIFIPQDGTIEGIVYAIQALLNADAEFANVEMSFISTNQLGTNDARGAILTLRMQTAVLTAVGGVVAYTNGYVPYDLSVQGGERVYMHVDATAGVVSYVTMQLQFRSGASSRRALRRT